MLHLGIVCFFISSMHPDESSECNYVCLFFYYFFNLHLHPGGLINEMTKIYFLNFWRESSIFTVLAKNNFYGFCEKCVFGEKMRFCVFGSKIRFYGFGGNYLWVVLMKKCIFAGLTGKCCFGEKMYFAVFVRKTHFYVFSGKYFLQKNVFWHLSFWTELNVYASKCTIKSF